MMSFAQSRFLQPDSDHLRFLIDRTASIHCLVIQFPSNWSFHWGAEVMYFLLLLRKAVTSNGKSMMAFPSSSVEIVLRDEQWLDSVVRHSAKY